jgi:hypothetical protein
MLVNKVHLSGNTTFARVRLSAEVPYLFVFDRALRGKAGTPKCLNVKVAVKKYTLSGYDGLALHIVPSDRNRYTFSLTDEIPPRRPDARELRFRPCVARQSRHPQVSQCQGCREKVHLPR